MTAWGVDRPYAITYNRGVNPIQTRLPPATTARLERLVTPGETTSAVVRRLIEDALDLREVLSRCTWRAASASAGVLVVEGAPDDLKALLFHLSDPE